MRTKVEETRLLPSWGRKLGRRSSVTLTERGSGTLGNDAVFALAVGHVVRGGHATLRPEHRVSHGILPGLLRHDTRHRGGIAVDSLGFGAALNDVAVI